MIRDIALLVHSVLNSKTSSNGGRYWDRADEDEFQKLVGKHLSNKDDPERAEIRKILINHGVEEVLDLGCGIATEKTSYDAYGVNVHYVGLDMSSRMLNLAKNAHPETDFVMGNLKSIPFQDNSYDAVLLKHTLEHQIHYENAVSEAVRVSKNIVIINFFHRLLPGKLDLRLEDRRGFHNNWYGRKKFEKYIESLPVLVHDRVKTTGTIGQTAEIYVLRKKRSSNTN